jgi:hypothetical protein
MAASGAIVKSKRPYAREAGSLEESQQRYDWFAGKTPVMLGGFR